MEDVRIPVTSHGTSVWNIVAAAGCIALGLVLIVLLPGGRGNERYAGPGAIALGVLGLAMEIVTRRRFAKTHKEILFREESVRLFDPGSIREVDVRYDQITEARVYAIPLPNRDPVPGLLVRWKAGAKVEQISIGEKLVGEAGFDRLVEELERRSVKVSDAMAGAA